MTVTTSPRFRFSDENPLPIEGYAVITTHRDYDISPDGERFLVAFPVESAERQVIIYQDWFSELSERVGAR